MIKVFANFLLAITSMSVPVAAGSFMHVYTEDKKPTSFEELKFQTIIEIPDEEEVDEEKDEPEEEEEVTDAGKGNVAPAGGSTVNATSNASNSGPQATATKTQAPSAPSQTTPQSNPVIAKTAPVAPVSPVNNPSPPVPTPSSQPTQAPPPPPGGTTPTGTTPSNTKGIEMTIDALKHFVSQEVSKNNSQDAEFAENWQKALTALNKLPDAVQKALLDSFQLS